ncbi:nitroreductase family protein [Pararhodobacter sp. CCB-MM2]|uniref:nitroreductase family protein n=1 Tax=Pararhodobacter sp. CCB-MM2 TaxID=1786003 RepID=UPI00083741B8|nr:nitroreductase family protein [Pararhodobacter sp. CCB-MM2]
MSDPISTRYGGAGPEGLLPLTPVMELMLRHRSVRRYQDRPLPEGLLEALVACGQSAATSSNMQAVSLVAVTDPARRQRFAKASSGQAFVAEAPVILCFVLDQSRAERVGAATGADLWALPLVDNFIAAATDAAILAQNILLAAQSAGLGGCYIGNLRNDPEFVARELALPPRAMVLFGMALGYEAPPETGIRPRLPQSVVLHREHYSTEGEAEALAAYDTVFAAHELAQGRPKDTWTARHKARYANVEYLDGRINLRAILKRMGFPLE